MIHSAVQHVNDLIRGEIALARAEVKQSLRMAAAGVGMLAIALALALVVLNVLAVAIVAGLAEAGLHPGWAAMIVGAFFLIAAGVLVPIGTQSLDPDILSPTRMAHNFTRDVETVKKVTKDTRGS